MASPPAAIDLLNHGVAHHQAGRLDEAEACYRRAWSLNPNGWDAPHLLGLVAHARGRHAEAVDLIARAVKAKPNEAGFWFNYGNVLAAAGRDAQAVDVYRQATFLKPTFVEAYVNGGNALERLGRLPEVVRVREAVARLTPADPEAHLGVGWIYHRLGHLGPAVAAYRGVLDLRPDHVTAHRHLTVALAGLRQTAAAADAARAAIRLDPADAGFASNLLLTLQYGDAVPPAGVFAEHVAWGDRFPAVPRPPAARRPGRVRVGYVSGDFRDHPVAGFILPLLRHHDRDRFEVFCYSTIPPPGDAATALVRAAADQWRELASQSDDAAAALVAADGIDVLVDLSGHTAGHRLGLFARRPAAVQVTYLGYPGTTGLRAMDYRITDAVADPPGATDALHTERLVRLPRCFLCPAPPPLAPDVGPGPDDDAFTFASFNVANKVSPTTVRLWAGVLAAVPNGVLAVKAVGLMGDDAKARLRAEFAAAGVDPGRVRVWPVDPNHRDHLGRYGNVDVAVDTFPYNGTTTTVDALWMGVPVVTLAGATHASRVGASLLTAAGLGGWVAESRERFVEIAAGAAADRTALKALRRGMRERLLASPLFDGAGFARAIEAAYDGMVTEAV